MKNKLQSVNWRKQSDGPGYHSIRPCYHHARPVTFELCLCLFLPPHTLLAILKAFIKQLKVNMLQCNNVMQQLECSQRLEIFRC